MSRTCCAGCNECASTTTRTRRSASRVRRSGTPRSSRPRCAATPSNSSMPTARLIAGDDRIDQWYVAHPTELTRRRLELAVVNPDNPFVLRAQVACAANELPLTPADTRWFGDGLDDIVREFVHDDLLKPRG